MDIKTLNAMDVAVKEGNVEDVKQLKASGHETKSFDSLLECSRSPAENSSNYWLNLECPVDENTLEKLSSLHPSIVCWPFENDFRYALMPRRI